jgi:cytochrome c2
MAASSSATSPPTQTPAAATDACAAFHRFYDDLNTRGPAVVGQLLREAEAVQQAASDGAAFGDPVDASFVDDADALLDYVEQPDFATTGTVAADPVQELVQDCS